jgi:hypothetical protein
MKIENKKKRIVDATLEVNKLNMLPRKGGSAKRIQTTSKEIIFGCRNPQHTQFEIDEQHTCWQPGTYNILVNQFLFLNYILNLLKYKIIP